MRATTVLAAMLRNDFNIGALYVKGNGLKGKRNGYLCIGHYYLVVPLTEYTIKGYGKKFFNTRTVYDQDVWDKLEHEALDDEIGWENLRDGVAPYTDFSLAPVGGALEPDYPNRGFLRYVNMMQVHLKSVEELRKLEGHPRLYLAYSLLTQQLYVLTSDKDNVYMTVIFSVYIAEQDLPPTLAYMYIRDDMQEVHGYPLKKRGSTSLADCDVATQFESKAKRNRSLWAIIGANASRFKRFEEATQAANDTRKMQRSL